MLTLKVRNLSLVSHHRYVQLWWSFEIVLCAHVPCGTCSTMYIVRNKVTENELGFFLFIIYTLYIQFPDNFHSIVSTIQFPITVVVINTRDCWQKWEHINMACLWLGSKKYIRLQENLQTETILHLRSRPSDVYDELHLNYTQFHWQSLNIHNICVACNKRPTSTHIHNYS